MMKKVIVLAAFAVVAVPSMAQVKYAVSGTYDGNGNEISRSSWQSAAHATGDAVG